MVLWKPVSGALGERASDRVDASTWKGASRVTPGDILLVVSDLDHWSGFLGVGRAQAEWSEERVGGEKLERASTDDSFEKFSVKESRKRGGRREK